MAQRFRVDCIRKRDRQNPHERIEGIGGANPIGSAAPRWYLEEDDAIVAIEAQRWSFFVNVGAKEVGVIVARNEGRKYLKTEADDYAPNNLLNLPECP
jgi:hypothetical protein